MAFQNGCYNLKTTRAASAEAVRKEAAVCSSRDWLLMIHIIDGVCIANALMLLADESRTSASIDKVLMPLLLDSDNDINGYNVKSSSLHFAHSDSIRERASTGTFLWKVA
jgi:hypothetical protein